MNSLLEDDDEVRNTVRELLAANKVLCLGTCANGRRRHYGVTDHRCVRRRAALDHCWAREWGIESVIGG